MRLVIILLASLLVINVSLAKDGEIHAKKTSVLGVEVDSITEQQLVLDITYYYDGQNSKPVFIGANLHKGGKALAVGYRPQLAREGEHTVRTTITRDRTIPNEHYSEIIKVFIYEGGQNAFVTRDFEIPLKWSALAPPEKAKKQSDKDYNDSLLAQAISWIDESHLGDSKLDVAQKYLDEIIISDPDYVRAYLELARVYMKKDTTVSGHYEHPGDKKAEKVINIALEIDPNYADTHVLLGYVYVLQKRYQEAEISFKTADRLGTDNLWLEHNWGLLLERTDREEEAIKIYNKAINGNVDFTDQKLRSHNRAIYGIYSKLINLLEVNEDWDQLDKVYAKRLISVPYSCQEQKYGEFRLERFNDFDKAIELANIAVKEQCGNNARSLLGKAYFTKWIIDDSLSNDEKISTRRKAQAFSSDHIDVITYFASSSISDIAIPALIKINYDLNFAGESGLTPLAQAVSDQNFKVAEKLLKYGADPNKKLTDEEWTALMIAALNKDYEMSQLLILYSADVEVETTTGYSSVSIAQSNGDNKLVNLLKEARKL